MAQKEKTIEQVLSQAEETLFTAKLGLDHVLGNEPKARVAGLRNLIVFGRAVTNVLQNLRSIVPDFDAWYQKYVDEMQVNPLMRFFYKLRSEVLKEGSLNVHSSTPLSGDPMEAFRRFQPPPRAKAFFIGDRIGGSGWEVEIEDGTTEKYYVAWSGNLPGLQVDVNIHFPEAPEEFRDCPATELCMRYYEYLQKMVADAKATFGR